MPDISFGLDLATSASIIGASIAYVMSERKRRLSERNWRRELNSQKQVELSHSIVKDVLDFLPVITSTGLRIRDSVYGQRPSLSDGTELVTIDGVAHAIREEFIHLREKIEFELLRPLEVKIDFVDGQEVWDREVAKCRTKLGLAEQAMEGLVAICTNPNSSAEVKLEMLEQAIPFLLATEQIGGEHDSVYSALIDLAKDLKCGLLAIQPT